ncbi:DUF3761 domain-containing protein [Dyella silvatica]|uniref:DUF3761 domain-containing protein n=1 Tax=Dyella silvatica TaxID=2992128 RepID=UPI0031B88629
MRSLSFIAWALACLLSDVANAQVAQQRPMYRCMTSNGITYTNIPAPGCVVVFLYTPKPNSGQSTQDTRPPTTDSHLIEQGSYVNHDGLSIHRPAHTDSGLAPPGASAQCADGSFSFSTHHSGTCSHHGGVTRWL